MKTEAAAKSTNAARVWKSLGEMFGLVKFQQQFGDEPNEMWIDACSELTHVQIREALRKVRNSGSQWPPNLPEFMAYARSTDLRPLPAKPKPEADGFAIYVDLLLWRYLCSRGAASPESLTQLIAAKNYWRDVYRTICEDEPKASLELRDKLIAQLDAVYEPMCTPDILEIQDRFVRARTAVALRV